LLSYLLFLSLYPHLFPTYRRAEEKKKERDISLKTNYFSFVFATGSARTAPPRWRIGGRLESRWRAFDTGAVSGDGNPFWDLSADVFLVG
jgi:hypothetical protein